MSKKNKGVLTESSIRRWAKLADIKSINEETVKRFGLSEEEDYEEEMPDIGEPPMEEPVSEEPPMPEPEEEPVASSNEEIVTNLVSAIADAIEDVAGVEIEVASDAAPVEEPPMEEPPMEEPVEELPPAPVAPEEEEPEEELEESVKEPVEEEKESVEEEKEPVEEEKKELNESKREKAINELAKRVAKRLLENKKK